MPTRTVLVSAVEQMRRTFANAPPCQAEQVTMMEAIRSLMPEIHGMQQKGYGLAAIAKSFSEQGMDLTEATLRCYMQRAKATGGRKKRKGKAPASPQESTGAASAPQASPVARGTGADMPAASATPAPPPTKPLPEPPKFVRPATENVPPRRSSFVPREDTKDL